MSTNKRYRTKAEIRDTISDLPDSLLVHILSFLPTKEAVATSLLSKRWRPLWCSLPNLDFDDGSFHSLEFFLQYIDAALHLVNLKSVKMFALKCERFNVPHVKVNIWVNNALVSYKLTYLELHFEKGCIIRLPSSVFMCNTITVLKLHGFIVGHLSTVNLPSLKVLHLKFVQFSNSKSLAKLLSKCLHLEELVLKYLDIRDVDSTLDITRFKHLLLADVPASLFPIKAFSNAQFLSLSEHVWYPGGDIPTFHNLIHLQIDHFAYSDWTTVSFLRSFPKLQSLVILNYGYHGSDDEWLMELTPNVPPCVSSHLKEFALIGFQGYKREFEIVKFILNNASVLRTVIVGSAGTCERKGFEMLKKLSSYPRDSANCRLYFDVFGMSIEKAMRKCLTIRKQCRFKYEQS